MYALFRKEGAFLSEGKRKRIDMGDFKRPELLAPAGGIEQLKAAVYHGADAIYFGGERFSARAKAANFTREELIAARILTRRRGVRMYCAINTLLFADEMEDALSYIAWLDALGIDALIIQDLGLLSMVRKHFPGMEIHSSTQMSVANHHGLDLLKELGVARAVLPRETSLEDLRLLKDHDIETEIFVHGAICICFSGQCLMSSMIGGRSGNRGACAQPCRLKYSLMDRDTGEVLRDEMASLLSPKDMMLLPHMKELIALGVDSFKIEGRMKTPEYVATVVRHYRKAIDEAMEGRTYELNDQAQGEIAQVFSRDFTDAYLMGESGPALMNINKPNHRGVLLGRVRQASRGRAEVQLKAPLQLHDKLSIWTTKEGRVNFTADRIEGLDGKSLEMARAGEIVVLFLPKPVNREDRVFRVESVALKQRVASENASMDEEGLIQLSAVLKGSPGDHPILFLDDEDGFHCQATHEYILQEAIQHPLTEESFREQMRLGGTGYLLREVTLEAPSVMMPKSVLNQLRREGIRLLQESREAALQPEKIAYRAPVLESSSPLELSIQVETVEKLRTLGDLTLHRIHYPLMNYRNLGSSRKELLDFLAEGSPVNEKLILELPRIIREEELSQVVAAVEQTKAFVRGYRVHTLDGIRLLRSAGIREILGDASLNITNPDAFSFYLEEMGLQGTEYSKELNLSQLSGLDRRGQLQLFGRAELMVLEHCLIGSELGKGACRKRSYALKDRMEAEFPILADDLGKNHIFNSKTLLLAEEAEQLQSLGFGRFFLNLTGFNLEDSSKIAALYLAMLQGKTGFHQGGDKLKNLVKDYTKGHYYRGVQ